MVREMKYLLWALLSSAMMDTVSAQPVEAIADSARLKEYPKSLAPSFGATSDFLDAAISSLNAFSSLIKKENYRTRIASFNNPTSSDLGFSLENEIQSALKPLLAKAKNTNPDKFSQVVSSLLSTQKNSAGINSPLALANPVLPSLMGLVGNLTINEKRITRQDLDSFISNTSRYFVQYERLNMANLLFDQNIDRLNSKLKELQFDIREYVLDMILILHPALQRTALKKLSLEELFLRYLDRIKMEEESRSAALPHFPADGIKGAKEISASLQKLFSEYQMIYTENYGQIRNILSESKSLGKTINLKQVELSLKEIEGLYQESQQADIMGLRLNTLAERLKVLVTSEQILAQLKR